MSFQNTSNIDSFEKSISRVMLHEQLENFLKCGGTITQYPNEYSSDNPKKEQLKLSVKTLYDLKDEFDPSINKQILIDQDNAKKIRNHRDRITKLRLESKNASKSIIQVSSTNNPAFSSDTEVHAPNKPLTKKSSAPKVKASIHKENVVHKPQLTAKDKSNSSQDQNSAKSAREERKKQCELEKEQRKILAIQKSEAKALEAAKREADRKARAEKKALIAKQKAEQKAQKQSKPPKIRTRSKTPEDLKENLRRASVSKAKNEAIANGLTHFYAECRIHGYTEYMLSGSSPQRCRCVECCEEARERVKTTEERNVSIRLQSNKRAANEALKEGKRIFIGMCAYHLKSPHHIEVRTIKEKIKHEYRCCECKKLSKFKYYLNND